MKRLFVMALILALLIGGCVAYFRYRDRAEAEAASRSSEEFRDANRKLDDTLKLPRGM